METRNRRTRARTAPRHGEAAASSVLTTHGVLAAFAHPTPRTAGATWACADQDPDLFFPDDEVQLEQARSICAGCPFAEACLGLGTARSESGVWGGVLLADGTPLAAVPTRGRPRTAA